MGAVLVVLAAVGGGHLPFTSIGVGMLLAAILIPRIESTDRPDPRRSKARVRIRALEATSAGSWIWWLEDGRVQVDEAFLALAGLDAEDLDDRFETLLARIHPEDLADLHASLDAWTEPRSPRPAELEFRIRIRDRQDRWRALRLMGGLLDGDDLEAIGGLAIEDPRDVAAGELAARTSEELITALGDLSQANADLERTRADLERRNRDLDRARRAAIDATRSKSEFLANMSHEIRTPLAAIIGFADLIVDGEGPPEECREMAATIRRNGEHLLGLVGDVLDLSKIEAGRMEIERVPFDAFRCVADVVASFQPEVRARGIELHLDASDRQPGLVALDPTRFRQVVLNLIGNAVKFTEQGAIVVTVGHHPSSHRMEVTVTDTGIGLDESAMQRIFEPFRQADGSTTRRFGGSGLGLSISRTLCELLGGALSAESIPGRGSTFTAAFLAPPASLPTPDGEEDAPPPGLRILLAEDGPDNRRLVVHLLGRLGARVTAVENGAEAVERTLEEGPWDVVLLDMQMPVMDGWEAARRIRNAGSEVPIVAITANALPGDRQACLEAGCDAYLAKPIRRDRLARTLASVHRRRGVERRQAG